jgi:hypothetical protein
MEEVEMESLEPEIPLPEEFLLLEYQASEQKQVALYPHRDHFRPYWAGERWLKLDFEKGEPCVRARHFVGLMPFSCAGNNHLIMVAPKGCSFESHKVLGLVRFLELVAIADGGEPIEELEGVSFKLGRSAFFALLAAHYARLLHALCRRDYRRYFQPKEDDLPGQVRGRIHIAGHIRNALRGREHRIPCQWEEFTSDNWDNRILLGAIRRLEQGAASFAPEAARFVSTKFLGLEPWFSSVEEVPVQPTDFNKARLWRTSRYYRNALAWARLIIQGLARPVAGGRASPLVIDANDAFERFAKLVTRGAVSQVGGSWRTFSANLEFFRDRPTRKPDLAIQNHKEVVAVGDAKYKDILDQPLSHNELGDLTKGIIPKISSADWNQLYVYMRLANASHGFFVVPFWNPAGNAAQLVPDSDFKFAVSPLDGAEARQVRCAVVGLNLIQPLQQVRREAVQLLSRWFRGFSA